MSDININGIMNMGFAGGGGGTFGGNAATGQPAMSADQINASMGWNPNAAAFNPWGNTPGGFGGQTDYYSSLGAAYGRATGGFNGGGNNLPGYYPAGDVTSSPLLALDYNDSAGMPSDGGGVAWQPPQPYQDPFTGAAGGGGMGSVYDPGGYAQQYRMPIANPEYFTPDTYAGDQGNYGIPYQGAPIPGDIGFTRQGPMPNLGYNPSMQHWFANPDMGGGQVGSRFGQWGPNAGAPSQYTSTPYTDTRGQTFAPNLPPGYAPAFNADQPGGALPLGSLFDNLPGGG